MPAELAWGNPMRVLMLLGVNIFITFLVCNLVGPSAFKLDRLFGLVAWAGRVPFFLLQLYIAPIILFLGPSRLGRPLHGALLGLLCTIPLSFWSIATKCSPPVQATYLLSGILQGWLIAWLAHRWRTGVKLIRVA